jgi:hypothetical protein
VVAYDGDLVTVEQIVEALASVGYQARAVEEIQ